jgi:hypothetical protein
VAAFGLAVGTVRVDHLDQMPDGLAQPRRVQPAGCLHQHRVGLQLHVLREALGALGDHPGMGRRDRPTGQRRRRLGQGPAKEGPGGPDRGSSRTGAHPEAAAQPGRRRPHLLTLVGAGRSLGIDGRDPPQPLAF